MTAPGPDREIRVGFAPAELLRWLGGAVYLRNLLAAIERDPSTRLRPMLFVGKDATDDADRFRAGAVVRSRIFDRRTPPWLVRSMSRRALHHDVLWERLLRRNGVAALSHTSQIWKRSGAAMLGWIPDFQHRRLPELFSRRERRLRDRAFREITDRSTLVIVSSESAARDLAEFSPEHAAKARILRFVALPPAESAVPSRETVLTKFGIEGAYFHMANQFWVHKNHEVLLDALRILRERRVPASVVATGDQSDYRRPGHFAHLQGRAKQLGVEDRFITPGRVSIADLTSLMRHSVAVVNPSLFEGWSTGVEEAKSIGKRVLLSDIDVHREQDPPGGVFFEPHDPSGLASGAGPSDRGP